MGIITTIERQEGETVDSKTAIKMIEEDGWYLDRVKGSHHQYKHPTKRERSRFPTQGKTWGI